MQDPRKASCTTSPCSAGAMQPFGTREQGPRRSRGRARFQTLASSQDVPLFATTFRLDQERARHPVRVREMSEAAMAQKPITIDTPGGSVASGNCSLYHFTPAANFVALKHWLVHPMLIRYHWASRTKRVHWLL